MDAPALLPMAIGLAFACSTMFVLWLIQRKTGNAGIVDVAWAGLVGAIGVIFALWPSGIGWLRAIVGTMIGLWSLRLTSYLYRRVVGHPEEGRYVSLRNGWGEQAHQKFFAFFQAQAILAWCFALPVLIVVRSPEAPSNGLVVLSILLWSVGISGVTLSDRQLAKFKKDSEHRGKTCRVGLWRYSRHPNYFFEWLHWCAYVPLSWGSAYWWGTALVAGMLLYAVLFVTGIPPTEAQALASRGEDYRQYQRTTSAFFPWFPKRLVD